MMGYAQSIMFNISNPICSSRLSTRNGVNSRTTPIQIKVPITATTIVSKMLIICAINKIVSPKNNPFHLATSLIEV